MAKKERKSVSASDFRLPKFAKVYGHSIQVLHPYVFTERSDLIGQYDHCTKRIRVASKVNGEQVPVSTMMQAYIHELLHAWSKTSGHNAFEGEEMEGVLDGLAEFIYMFLNDNGYLD